MATECSNKNHSATFPYSLPEWFIKLFTQRNDVVLDPFLGSGTTVMAAKTLDRSYIGMDANIEYCKISERRLENIKGD